MSESPAETAEEPREDRISTTREYYESLLVVLILLNFVRIFTFQTFKIPTGSMVDNLLVGDHVLVNKYIFGAPGPGRPGSLVPSREISRGDIVVFRYPLEPEIDYVKRVIALPGETVEIRDKEVFINGRPLEEPWKIHSDPAVYPRGLPGEIRRDQYGPVRIPAGRYFVMGDNRDNSSDSRYWGPVSRSLIKGKPVLVYWSFRGEPPPPGSPGIERIRELMGVAIHFFSRTRWDRTFFVVDSHYHYHAEPGSN